MRKMLKKIVSAVLVSAIMFTSLNIQSAGADAASKNKRKHRCTRGTNKIK